MSPLISESDSTKPSSPQRSLATIERKIKELQGGRQSTRRRVQIAHQFAEAHLLLRRKRGPDEADQIYQAWCQENFNLDPVAAQEMRQIGETLEPSQVRTVSLGYDALYAICQAPRAQHQTLLRHGSRQQIEDIQRAVKQSDLQHR